MAVESPIEPAADWFRGEHKIMRFTLPVDNGPITGWTFEWTVYPYPDGDAAAVLTKNGGSITVPSFGDPQATPPTAPVIQVEVQASDTAELDPKAYRHVLRRIDAGNEGVLSYGVAVLKDPRTA